MNDLIVLTPPGWAAAATLRLTEQFTELAGYEIEIQTILLPLFRKAVDGAIERACQGLLTDSEKPTHEDPSPRS